MPQLLTAKDLQQKSLALSRAIKFEECRARGAPVSTTNKATHKLTHRAESFCSRLFAFFRPVFECFSNSPALSDLARAPRPHPVASGLRQFAPKLSDSLVNTPQEVNKPVPCGPRKSVFGILPILTLQGRGSGVGSAESFPSSNVMHGSWDMDVDPAKRG